MIVKNLTWKRFYPLGLMRYINDTDKTQPQEMPIYWNIPKPTFKGALEAFKENHLYQNLRKDSNVLLHDILSFSPDDHKHLTPDKIRDLVYKYLELRAPHNLAYAQIHVDKGHYHVHIAISPNPYKHEKVLHLNNEKYRQIRIDLETYQLEKYPELENSVVFLNKTKSKEKSMSVNEFEMRKRGGKTIVDILKETVQASFQAATSVDEFYNFVLQKDGIQIYKRNGKEAGILYNGKKYRFKLLGILREDITKLQNKEQSFIDNLISKQK